VRNPGLPAHARLQELTFDFDHPSKLPRADDIFCCLGTTIKKAGSQAAFRKVDYDYVVSLADHARDAGAKRFLVVSSLGADARSSIFYSRVKGEMEAALRGIGFDALHIFQPSLLLGDRREARLGERLGIAASAIIAPFMLGPAKKYRPIDARVVANAMWKTAWNSERGIHVHPSNEIAKFGG
jgi:uncharacterized protein YbjT (DUF2867 family)